MKKIEKKKISTLKEYQQVFQLGSPTIKKNKKNLELLQSITKFESKEFKLIKNLIFNDSLILKLEDHELYRLLETKNLLNVDWEKMDKFLEEFTRNIKSMYGKMSKIKSETRKRNLKYLEFITGIESEIIEEIFQNTSMAEKKSIIKSKQEKLQSVSEIEQEYQKVRIKNDKKELFFEMMKNKGNLLIETLPKSKQKLLVDKRRASIRKDGKIRIIEQKNKTSLKKMTSQLDRIKKKKEERKIKLKKISHLKHSCSTCSQKVTKTYKKTMMIKLEKKIEAMEQLEGIYTNLKKDRMQDLFRITNESYLPYEDAKEFVNIMGFKSKKEWDEYAIKRRKLPVNIPKYPHIAYRTTEEKQGWAGWADWLGVEPKKMRSFKETKEFLQKMNINNNHDWVKAINSGILPADIPRNPQIVYNKNWKGIKDFFNK